MVLSMIDSKKVIRFFDDCAAGWDAGMVKNDGILEKVLDCAETGRGKSVLDIGCGTGVLFPYYLARGVSSLVGVDFSPKMAAIAAENVKGIPSCEVLCEDALSLPFRGEFDVCVVYNAGGVDCSGFSVFEEGRDADDCPRDEPRGGQQAPPRRDGNLGASDAG